MTIMTASLDQSTIDTINIQAASSAAVDNGSITSPTGLAEKERLEKLLKNRSEAKDLQEKNILRSGTVAPALQAAHAGLEKAQLEDKLEGRLERRPDREDLERRGILKDQSVAPALQGKMTELERSQLENRLEKEFASRPKADSLMAKGILKEGDI